MFDYVFLIILSPILVYYLYFLLSIYKGLNNLSFWENNNLPNEFVTVIIPFRNESDNIIQSLRSIEKQNYPTDKLEVIYVNDSSTDDSEVKLKSQINSEHIRVIS
ncbi:MAG TPA: glycosyltransferase, partial [Ignavibacteria bacterium]|nr:glycosyltransferase [Ignavibacteria bacterium]